MANSADADPAATCFYPSFVQALERGRLAAAAAHSLTAEGEEEGASPRARLVALFEAHAPEKLANVSALLTKYAGKEAELLRKVADKYGASV